MQVANNWQAASIGLDEVVDIPDNRSRSSLMGQEGPPPVVSTTKRVIYKCFKDKGAARVRSHVAVAGTGCCCSLPGRLCPVSQRSWLRCEGEDSDSHQCTLFFNSGCLSCRITSPFFKQYCAVLLA